MNIPRLNRMIAVLEEVEAKHAGHFDIRTWMDIPDGTPTLAGQARKLKAHKCGSVACALGWFYTIEKEELWLNHAPNPLSAATYFEITQAQADNLFLQSPYGNKTTVTPRHVINRIREMIRDGISGS